jgi:hypothetical protein
MRRIYISKTAPTSPIPTSSPPEIVEDLEARLAQFAEIANDLEKSK